MARGNSRVVAGLALASVALLLGMGVALEAAHRSSKSALEDTFSQRAAITADLIASTLEQSVAQMQAAASLEFGDRRITEKALRGTDGLTPTIVTDAKGRVLGAYPPRLARRGSSIAGWGPGIKAVLAGRPGAVNSSTGPSRDVSIVAGFPTPHGRRLAITIVPDALLDGYLAGYLRKVRPTEDDEAFIVDEQGRVAGSATPGTGVAIPADEGAYDEDGEARFAALAAVPGIDWQVVVTTSADRLYEPVRGLGQLLSWLLFAGMAALTAAVVVLVRRVARNATQLERANEELAVRNREVMAADKMKSEFLATMSHELRTPLNSIMGFAELLHDGKLGDVSAEQREFLRDILASSTHLRRLIDDVLDLSKIEAGKLDLRPEPVDVGEVVREVCDVVGSLAVRRHITLRRDIDPAIGVVELDPAKLKQVLFNYVSNALKFSPDGGHVTVSATREDDARLRLTVEDDGPGIGGEDLDRLWRAFEQLDSGDSRRFGGTGLGLSLTRKIVEAQGGEVSVESVVDEGSRFHAVLPAIPARSGLGEPLAVA